MNYSGIDWLVTWKLFHYEFLWICLALSVPIRIILARGLNRTSARRRILYVAVSSIIFSLVSTWFPVIPIITGAVLNALAGNPGGVSLVISAPLVGVSLGIETSLIDAILFRLFLKGIVNRRFIAVLVANVVNATIALTLGLLWAIHHMPTFEAALN